MLELVLRSSNNPPLLVPFGVYIDVLAFACAESTRSRPALQDQKETVDGVKAFHTTGRRVMPLRNANHAGMRWPHQSWREMHHGLMSSSLRGVARYGVDAALSVAPHAIDGVVRTASKSKRNQPRPRLMETNRVGRVEGHR